ncbi:hypothetical protein [Streptococcus sanguinis]|uniref:hypothetical protein n=1 Tax=Streptococcus sanguinis TaxID=1305 RepID=UPI001CBC5D06|nr:hypothetical protein [Streptococcus sanguinis]MBZ2021418.1 hypothetical protein [Streptococcus sanguinis]MBZ2073737.1 hypothetical protein [Streptococcus sanguinis]MBZ2081660.1 hypothetical protein [Streptococcus sanguinis]MCC3165738.1 putative prophage protein [Streptococcus sanguinis]
MKNDVIQKVKIGSLDFGNPFFDSLRADYPEFNSWLSRKSGEYAYILEDYNQLLGFLYLKDEVEADENITPSFDMRRRLKIGTFKIDSHGTVLGQRFLSIILRKMLNEEYDFTYVTLFPGQEGLINLFKKFGFRQWGTKNNGELVYYKDLAVFNDIYKDFPRINLGVNSQKHLLGIWPDFHTKLFPNSRLNTERTHVIEDLSFTNTSEKIYLTKMVGVQNMFPGDLVVIYRTAEGGRAAEYSSVATSICTVVEVISIYDFVSIGDFLQYCGKGTIFTQNELINFWNTKRYPYIIKMLYNLPLERRIVRRDLIEQVGLDRDEYFGYLTLTDNQFYNILEMGEINESFIIN